MAEVAKDEYVNIEDYYNLDKEVKNLTDKVFINLDNNSLGSYLHERCSDIYVTQTIKQVKLTKLIPLDKRFVLREKDLKCKPLRPNDVDTHRVIIVKNNAHLNANKIEVFLKMSEILDFSFNLVSKVLVVDGRQKNLYYELLSMYREHLKTFDEFDEGNDLGEVVYNYSAFAVDLHAFLEKNGCVIHPCLTTYCRDGLVEGDRVIKKTVLNLFIHRSNEDLEALCNKMDKKLDCVELNVPIGGARRFQYQDLSHVATKGCIVPLNSVIKINIKYDENFNSQNISKLVYLLGDIDLDFYYASKNINIRNCDDLDHYFGIFDMYKIYRELFKDFKEKNTIIEVINMYKKFASTFRIFLIRRDSNKCNNEYNDVNGCNPQ